MCIYICIYIYLYVCVCTSLYLTVFRSVFVFMNVCVYGLYRGRSSSRRQVPFAVRCCLPKNTEMCLQTSASGHSKSSNQIFMPSLCLIKLL